jgi:hypothetical protein
MADVTPLATAHTVTSASIGTALVTGAGSIVSITVAAAPVITDQYTQLCLVDDVVVSGNPQRVLFASDQIGMEYLFEPRPGVALTPGTTAPAYPKTIAANISFTNGCFVKSCPAGTTFTVTA